MVDIFQSQLELSFFRNHFIYCIFNEIRLFYIKTISNTIAAWQIKNLSLFRFNSALLTKRSITFIQIHKNKPEKSFHQNEI